MKAIIKDVIKRLKRTFPDTPILPGFGNNDVVYHDSVPAFDQKTEFYDEVYDLWFTNVEANKEILNEPEIRESFLDGGYYSYQASEDLMIITLNSLYNLRWNNKDKDGSVRQLHWLEDVMDEASDSTKFIIQMHIFEGLNWYEGVENFWTSDSLEDFIEILVPYEERIIALLGSHTHYSSIRSPMSSVYPDFKFTEIINPSVTPVYYNNPGYSWLEFSNEKKIENFTKREMMLDKFESGEQAIPEFISVDPQEQFSIDLNDPETIRQFVANMAEDLKLYANFNSISSGKGPSTSTTGISRTEQVCTTCAMKYLTKK